LILMAHVLARLFTWTEKTTTFFSELRAQPDAAEPADDVGDDLIYRLKHWPQIPTASKRVQVYRTLSVMSIRPVNRRWILSHSGLQLREVDRLLQYLIDQDAVEIIDPAKFRLDASAA
jgi:hypothetical protein